MGSLTSVVISLLYYRLLRNLINNQNINNYCEVYSKINPIMYKKKKEKRIICTLLFYILF